MHLQRQSLAAALATHVSADLANRLADALTAVRARQGRDGGDAIDADELGEVLAEALAPGAGEAIAETALTSVDIAVGTLTAALNGEEAIVHPLLRAWLPQTLGEAIAAPIVRAVTLAALAPGQATQRLLDVLERGDHPPRGIAIFVIATPAGDGHVVARYGAGEDPAMTRIHRLDGPAFASAGWSTHLGSSTGRRGAPAPEAALDAAIPTDAVRH